MIGGREHLVAHGFPRRTCRAAAASWRLDRDCAPRPDGHLVVRLGEIDPGQAHAEEVMALEPHDT